MSLIFQIYWTLYLSYFCHHDLSFSKNLSFLLYYWPLDLPANTCEIKEIKPCGVIPIKYFVVWWCLFKDQVRFCAVKFVGWSIYNSKQLIITVIFLLRLSIKHCAILICNSGLSSQLIKGSRYTYKTFSMSKNIRETVAFRNWKCLLRPSTDNTNWRPVKHNKSWSNFVRTFYSFLTSYKKWF